MILDSFTSFIDNIKNKVTNPFFGTLIFVWAIRNWKLIFNIFNFDKNCTRYDRLQIITSYLKEDWFKEIMINIGVALIVMISGYIFLMLSRFIANFVEYNLTPRMNKYIAAKTLVADRLLLEEAENEFLRKSEELIKERKYNNELELRITELKIRINELDTQKVEAVESDKENQSLLKKENVNVKNLEKQNEKLLKDNRKLTTEKNDIKKQLDANDSMWELKFQLLKDKILPFRIFDSYITIDRLNLTKGFKDISKEIIEKINNTPHSSFNENMIRVFVENNLMKKIQSEKIYDGFDLEMTEDGLLLYDKMDLIEKSIRDWELAN